MFLALAGLLAGQTAVILTIGILYINAKIDPIRDQVSLLVQYMIGHEGRISKLEAQTK